MKPSKRPQITKLAQTLPSTVPFVGPEAIERQMGTPFLARLGANENTFGPSPKAIAAMQASTGEIWKYGDPENSDLTEALAEFHGVSAQNIMVGEGIDGLLGYTARLFVEKDVPVVTSNGAYPTFNYHVIGYGGTLHKVDYSDDHEDLDALLQEVERVDARLVYLANPDNPMGTWWSADEINTFIKKIPQDCMVVLDEAYIEFAPEGTALTIDVNCTNVLRYRTFSKVYGMAGARVGYVIGEAENIIAFNKIRNHFGMNRTAQIGALAALEDVDYVDQMRNQIAKTKQYITEIVHKNGLTAIPSATNFLTIDCGRDSDYAKAVLAKLGEKGVFVRMPGVEPLSRCIRVSCGREEEVNLFEKTLPQVLEE